MTESILREKKSSVTKLMFQLHRDSLCDSVIRFVRSAKKLLVFRIYYKRFEDD